MLINYSCLKMLFFMLPGDLIFYSTICKFYSIVIIISIICLSPLPCACWMNVVELLAIIYSRSFKVDRIIETWFLINKKCKRSKKKPQSLTVSLTIWEACIPIFNCIGQDDHGLALIVPTYQSHSNLHSNNFVIKLQAHVN